MDQTIQHEFYLKVQVCIIVVNKAVVCLFQADNKSSIRWNWLELEKAEISLFSNVDVRCTVPVEDKQKIEFLS